jgi:prolyl oligopeptidase
MADYETKQVFYPSKDGTQVPMFIVHKKGLELDGNNPTYLYGYGGFNVSYTPSFSISRMLWLENGGVFVLANLRGGGEFGEEWHKAGMTPNKQNVFDDFIAAAEYLIQAKYTSPEKLAIAGGSNGGLLVGAVANQRPELFKVALPAVGVMDMLRFHKFTIGWGWVPEYGSSDNPEQFKNLLRFSPLHNIKDGVSYPATLVTTADHDDRVVPAHSFKYIARLQEKGAPTNPYLIRVAVKAGHGAGKSTAQQIEEATDIWAFVYENMGLNPYAATPE